MTHMKKFDTKTNMILYFLKGNKRYFFFSIVFACLVSLLDLINPKIIEYTVDCVIGHQKASGRVNAMIEYLGGYGWLRHHLGPIALLVVVIACIAALCRYLFTLFDAMGAEHFVQRMRNTLFAHILHLPYAWHVENHTGDIIQRCTSDVETIKVFVSEQLTQLFRVFLLIVLSLYFMITIHLALAMVAAVFIPIIVVGSVYFHNRIGDTFEQVDQEEGKLSSIVQENLTGVRVVRAFGKETYERRRFKKQNYGYTDLWVHLQKILAAFWTYGNVIATTRNLIIIVLGTVFCVQGHLTAGQFIAFFTYNTMLSLPVRRLGRVIAEMSKAGISIDRIRFIMNAEPESNRGKKQQIDMHQDIRFEHVSYQFEHSHRNVLDDVSFTVPAGATVGILGQTGSGKSTLMYLLDRLYELDQGHIYIGNTSISDIDRHWLRSHIGMVLQEPFLFSRTLLENIGIASHSFSQEEVDRVARLASLETTIAHFNDGLETFVGERGVTLSGGQKQRTAIAQMLMRRPSIMIFDDSLSAVDAQTDATIRKRLHTAAKGVTTILISHRISTIKEADWVVVMKEGRIVQQGTHDQLVRQAGPYQQTFALQTSQEEGHEA